MSGIVPGARVIKKGDLGIPGVTLRVYSVVRGPYRKYGQDMIDVVGATDFGTPGRYSNMYPADQFEVLTDERIARLTKRHGRGAS